MKKENRKRLKSCKHDHVLVEVDFKSCEPNFYLKAIGQNVDHDDVYYDISLKTNLTTL